jgi:uncharacterized membrane protein YoaT (DUF817 family)
VEFSTEHYPTLADASLIHSWFYAQFFNKMFLTDFKSHIRVESNNLKRPEYD